MPVFTFEKITPPDQHGPQPSSPPSSAKPRGVIVQMLDRFVETHVRRAAGEEKPAGPSQKSSE